MPFRRTHFFLLGQKKVSKKKALTQKIAAPTLPQILPANPLRPHTYPTQATDFYPAPRAPRYPHPPFLRPAHQNVAITRIALISTLNGWYLPKSKLILEKTARELALFKGIAIERTEMKELVRKLELKSYSMNTLKSYYCLVGAVPELPRASARGSDIYFPGFSHAW